MMVRTVLSGQPVERTRESEQRSKGWAGQGSVSLACRSERETEREASELRIHAIPEWQPFSLGRVAQGTPLSPPAAE